VSGRDIVAWGRLRADPGGDGVHVWVVADNLVGAGAGAALAVLQLAVEAGKLPRRSA
jgi:aspartate-semialdehyde dehydrogenase